MSHRALVEVTGQLVGIGSLLPPQGFVGNKLGSSGLAAGATEQSHRVSLLSCPVFFSHAHSLVFLSCFIFLSKIYLALWTALNRFFYLSASTRGETYS